MKNNNHHTSTIKTNGMKKRKKGKTNNNYLDIPSSERCVCGSVASSECVEKACVECCTSDLCLKHMEGEVCSADGCGRGVLENQCVFGYCVFCCTDLSCQFHNSIRTEANKKASKAMRKSNKKGDVCVVCGLLSEDIKCVAQQCTQSNCQACCQDYGCETHWTILDSWKIADYKNYKEQMKTKYEISSKKKKKRKKLLKDSSDTAAVHENTDPNVQQSAESRLPITNPVSISHAEDSTTLTGEDATVPIPNERKFYATYPYIHNSDDVKSLHKIFEDITPVEEVTNIDEYVLCVIIDDSATFDTYDKITILLTQHNSSDGGSIRIQSYLQYMDGKSDSV